MERDEKRKLALAAPERLTKEFTALAIDPVLKQSMKEAAKKNREMKEEKHVKRA